MGGCSGEAGGGGGVRDFRLKFANKKKSNGLIKVFKIITKANFEKI